MDMENGQFVRRLNLFKQRSQLDLLCCNLRGIERETLRVDSTSGVSQKAHPHTLGSPLTNPWITTDFSEALLEFITDPSPRVDEVLGQLKALHQFTAQRLPEDEMFWSNSMPGALGADSDIPIAQYGSSNIGQMKTMYRRGLGLRYGRKMQTIAGVHFNFSVPDAVWTSLRSQDHTYLSLQEYKTKGYFGLIRNFRRWFWLLLYTMGASPIVEKSFLDGRPHQLEPLAENDSFFHLPHATSMRMGDLGYQSSAQDSLYVCYNNINNYIGSLRSALLSPFDLYKSYGERNAQGDRHQLSSAILQIENEFYSTVRPKQTARPGETQLKALLERGVEYVEVRCVDINPFVVEGIDAEQVNFIEIFLLTCLFEDSPETDTDEYERILSNQKTVVTCGRKPGIELQDGDISVGIKEWGGAILTKMAKVAELLDGLAKDNRYSSAVAQAAAMFNQPDLTPSAKVLSAVEAANGDFLQWTLQNSTTFHNELVEKALDPAVEEMLVHNATRSQEKQTQIEQDDDVHFEQYLQYYFEQYAALNTE